WRQWRRHDLSSARMPSPMAKGCIRRAGRGAKGADLSEPHHRRGCPPAPGSPSRHIPPRETPHFFYIWIFLYRIYAVGRQNSGKSTSPTTEPTERPMHRATTLPVSEQTCSPEHCATLFVSLELSRSTWVATTLAPGSTKMSKHTLVGGDGRKLLDL